MHIPKYRKHSTRNYAIVEYRGDRTRLPGKYNSPESLAAYARFVAEITAGQSPAESLPPCPLVRDVVAAYLDYAVGYYSHAEYNHIRNVADRLLHVAGHLPATEFGPVMLGKVRAVMISGDTTAGFGPWARKSINLNVGRVRRIFRWAAAQQAIPASVWHALQTLEPLKKGRTAARETEEVKPVNMPDVRRLLPYCSPTLAAMLQIHLLTGMRSENLCMMKSDEIDRTSQPWRYVPLKHKNTWRDKKLCVYLGPKAQKLLKPFLTRDSSAYLFSPRESEAWRQAQRKAFRKSAVTPSQAVRKAKRYPRRPRGEYYTSSAYWRAVQYALTRCNRAEKQKSDQRKTPFLPVARFGPHQIRHAVATLVEKQYDIEASRVYLGHATIHTTAIYTARDVALAERVARDVG